MLSTRALFSRLHVARHVVHGPVVQRVPTAGLALTARPLPTQMQTERLARQVQRRWCAQEPPVQPQQPAGARPGMDRSVPAVVKVVQGAKVATKGTLYLGIAAVVLASSYFIFRELAPSRMAPNAVFNEAYAKLKELPEVTAVLGTPVKGYGKDFGGRREGRRNFVENVKWVDADGQERIKIRFNMQGPRGHAVVWAEKTGAMGNGEFFYLIFQADGHKPVHVVDHRPVVPLHQKQEGAVELLNKTDAVLFGDVNEEYTKRQLREFGKSMAKLRFVQCDPHSDKCEKMGVKGIPTWQISGHFVPGYKSLEDIQAVAQAVSKIYERRNAQPQVQSQTDVSSGMVAEEAQAADPAASSMRSE